MKCQVFFVLFFFVSKVKPTTLCQNADIEYIKYKLEKTEVAFFKTQDKENN